jgi:hypothetical protein
MPREREARTASYALLDSRWRVRVPGREALRLAFSSCNGCEDADVGQPNDLPDRNERWRHLAGRHARTPFHLLIQGGDQFYADQVWNVVAELRRLTRRLHVADRAHQISEEATEQVADFYFQRHTELWAQEDLRPVLACIPSVMMWDDHDIYDGYGSHPPSWETSAAHRAVFAEARNAFRLFQLGLGPDDELPGALAPDASHYSWCYRIGDTGILAPDLRATRTFEQVMSPEAWDAVERALDGLRDCRTVVIVSTVPIVNLNVAAAERVVSFLPSRLRFMNDLHDQWQSAAHRRSWQRILQGLLDLAARPGMTVVVLSGEIHLAAGGIARRDDTQVWQLTSSGIAHPRPSSLPTRLMEWVARRKIRLPGGIETSMIRFPESGRIYRADRNWLELDIASQAAPAATWHFDRDPRCSTRRLGVASPADRG